MFGEGTREQAREIIEKRMRHGLEADEAGVVFPRGLAGERAEPLVLPEDVIAPRGAMRNPEPPLAGQTDQPTVAEHRAEDHLELNGVRRKTAECRAGVFDHTDDFDRRLRPVRGRDDLPAREGWPNAISLTRRRIAEARMRGSPNEGKQKTLALSRRGL
jgi:hypothetical protein